MKDTDHLILEKIYYEEVYMGDKISLIGVVKNYIYNNEIYKNKLEFKNTTKDYIKTPRLNQHDVYWNYERDLDNSETIQYDRFKYNHGFNSFDGILLWTEQPEEESKKIVLSFLKDRFNIIPKKQIIWTNYLETERQKLFLRKIDGD